MCLNNHTQLVVIHIMFRWPAGPIRSSITQHCDNTLITYRIIGPNNNTVSYSYLFFKSNRSRNPSMSSNHAVFLRTRNTAVLCWLFILLNIIVSLRRNVCSIQMYFFPSRLVFSPFVNYLSYVPQLTQIRGHIRSRLLSLSATASALILIVRILHKLVSYRAKTS